MLTGIKKLRERRLAIVCLGNELRGDDGVGYHVYRLLKRRGAERVFYAATAPESYVFLLVELGVDAVVFVDAVSAGLEPGSLVFARVKDAVKDASSLSTHFVPLDFVARLLEEHGIETFILGIQVGKIEWGAELSPEVREAAEKVAELLFTLLEKR